MRAFVCARACVCVCVCNKSQQITKQSQFVLFITHKLTQKNPERHKSHKYIEM